MLQYLLWRKNDHGRQEGTVEEITRHQPGSVSRDAQHLDGTAYLWFKLEEASIVDDLLEKGIEFEAFNTQSIDLGRLRPDVVATAVHSRFQRALICVASEDADCIIVQGHGGTGLATSQGVLREEER
jgi:hypothetical protein